jgi:hypothetical protein
MRAKLIWLLGTVTTKTLDALGMVILVGVTVGVAGGVTVVAAAAGMALCAAKTPAAPGDGFGLGTVPPTVESGSEAPFNGNGLNRPTPVGGTGCTTGVDGEGLNTFGPLVAIGAAAPVRGKGLNTLPPEGIDVGLVPT